MENPQPFAMTAFPKLPDFEFHNKSCCQTAFFGGLAAALLFRKSVLGNMPILVNAPSVVPQKFFFTSKAEYYSRFMKFPQKVRFPVDKSQRTCYNQTNKSNDEEEYASPLPTEKRRSVQVFRQTMRKVASELRVRTSLYDK